MVAMHDSQTSVDLSCLGRDIAFAGCPKEIFRRVLLQFSKTHSEAVAEGLALALTPVSYEGGEYRLSIRSKLQRDWLLAHYKTDIVTAVHEVLGDFVVVNFNNGFEEKVEAQSQSEFNFDCPKTWLDESPMPTTIHSLVQPFSVNQNTNQNYYHEQVTGGGQEHSSIIEDNDLAEGFQLDERFTFDTFVAGPSNQMGLVASTTVVDDPGQKYSPLFLFGPAGLGKTHLLQAIGLELKRRNPNYRVLYVSAEQWVNYFIKAVREKKFDDFRRTFRNNCDILLVDDIQFLAGKEASQDEFFHTFNALHQARKQIVVTSDQYPHEIAGFAKRLQTRLAWGLVADIRPPEIETRLEILHRKARELEFVLTDEVALSLAQQITRSVRELEGALIRLSAYASMIKGNIDGNFVKEHLKPLFHRNNENINADKICSSVCAYYNIRVEDLKGQCRQKQVIIARQVAMLLCRSQLSMSLPQIGKLFGGRSHSTVLTAINRVENLRKTDIGTQSVFGRIEKLLFS